MTSTRERLDDFFFRCVPVGGKGNLAVLFQLTDIASADEFPLSFDNYLSPKNGQVAKLGGSRLRKLLALRGEKRTLAAEGGRTSRVSIDSARDHAAFSNAWHEEDPLSFDYGKIGDYRFEKASFGRSDRVKAIARLVDKYNEIAGETETDACLKIQCDC